MNSTKAPTTNLYKIFNFTNITLKGIGQIMLQENTATGFIFLIGIFIGSIPMGIATLLSAIIGTFTAYIFKFNEENINKGLYGFSAALVGAGLILFYKTSITIWFIICLGAILASLLQNFFIQKNISAFTLPFVVITWFSIIIINHFFPELIIKTTTQTQIESINYSFIFKNFGQIIFQDKLISGLLFFIAILISSPIAAIYGLGASVTATLFSYILYAQPDVINQGLTGYNAILCAFVFSGLQKSNILWAIIATLLACFISMMLVKFGIIELTFPFVLSSIITIQLRDRMLKQKQQ